MEKLVKQILENLFGSWQWPKNWVLKLVSFCLALFLWFFVAAESKVDMNVMIPVEIINLPSHLIISNEYKKELEVSVTGPRSLIRNLERSHTSRTVDMSQASSGPMVVTNEPQTIPLPWGVKLNRVNPAEFIIKLDELIDKKIPIQPVTSGKLDPGYKLISVMLEPATITVTAPKGTIGELESINTKPLEISKLTSSTMAHTSLDLGPKIAEIIGEPVVTASIIVEERQEHRSVSAVPLTLVEEEKRTDLHFSPARIKVMLTLPYSLAQQSKDLKGLLKATISSKGLTEGSHQVPIQVTGPAGIKVLQVEPDTAKITITATKKK